jgi:putative (di)nucleoside polyphosphate hydrolase
MLLLRNAEGGDGFEILLLHKPRKKDAWQLPQGGMEGDETPEECAVRELKEEAGLTGVQVLGTSDTVYQYDFPASYRRFRPDHICGQKIMFVFALAPENAEVRVDAKEVDRYQWVKVGALPKILKRKEYLELTQHLYAEMMAKLGK